MQSMPEQLRALVEPAVTALGYELVGVEYLARGRNGLLRVYIDRQEGITLDDCQKVSYQVSGVLDVEDPIPTRYTLEVSSPGLDRPLFREQDFLRFIGRRVKIRMVVAVAGRRKFVGTLLGLEQGRVMVEEEGERIELALGDIGEARLVPEL